MKIVSILLLAVLAGGLPASAAAGADGAQKNVVIVYGSRYGSTEQTAKWIAEGMAGRAAVVAAKDAGDIPAGAHVVLGSGIYGGRLHADMAAFLEKHGLAVKERIVALFVVCGMPPDQAGGYLEMFARACGVTPPLARAFNGWQKKELLSPEDYQGLERYYQGAGYPFENYDRTDKAKCLAFGKEILEKICAGR